MNTPYEKTLEPAKVIELPNRKTSPGGNAAKFSIIAAVLGTGLNLAGITALDEWPAGLAVAGISARVIVWAGVLTAAAGLIKAWNGRGSSAILLPAVGLLLNGGLLTLGLVHAPILGRWDARPQKTSTEKSGAAQTISSRSGRTIVTKDWTAGGMMELTDYNFDRVVYGSRVPVLVDFWAPWCGPCRKMSPIIEQLAADYEDKAKICKLNVDNARETAGKFGIRGIPTIILFNGEHVQKKWVGSTSRSAIALEINKLTRE